MASTNNTSSSSTPGMTTDNRWYFTAEQLANSPSRKHGIDADQELSFRQLTAYLIQEMGQRLQVSQLCINTAIVYMHRFYAFHSFNHFHRNGIAAAALFLAAKVEEQPRQLEHVIKVAHLCLNQKPPQPSSDIYIEQAQDLVFNENVLLQTLGFDVAIDHPHTHVVKTCHLVKACKDLAQTSYFLASNSLHLTPMCLQYRPTVVACFCIYLACKWSRWEIPQSTEGRHWFHYVDRSVTMDLLKQLTDEFLAIYEKSPARLKSKLNSIKALAQGARISEPERSLSSSTNGSSSQINQLEPARRPEGYSSHSKSHHGSLIPHSISQLYHGHGKSVSESGEHKSASKQIYPIGIAYSSTRPRYDRSNVSIGSVNEPIYSSIAHGGSKQQPLTSNSRSSSSSRPQHSIPPLASGSSSTQRISHGHDSNVYHKSRSSVPGQMNPQIPSHKVLPKVQDSTRPTIKERPLDISKLPKERLDPSKLPLKHPNNSVYSSQNSSNVGVDMTRSVLQSQSNVSTHQQQHLPSQQQQQQQPQQQQHQQRSYLPQTITQPSNFSQSTLNRGNNKYDQSVQHSTAHLQSNQKQSTEFPCGIIDTKPTDDSTKSGDQMQICSPPKSTYSQNPAVMQQHQSLQQHGMQYQQTSQNQQSAVHQKLSSIFSPEWNERTSQPNNLVNINNTSNNNVNKLGFNMKSSRDSPKKLEREKRSETPKKDKTRPETQLQGSMKYPQMEKRTDIKREDISQPSILTNITSNLSFDVKSQQIHALNFSASKRRVSRDNKFNDDISRDIKVRKTEPQSPPKLIDQKLPLLYGFDQQPVKSENPVMKSFPITVNGIETNPDLVSSLLKESLCRENKFGAPLIKIEPKDSESLIIDNQSMIMETLPEQLLQTDVPAIDESKSIEESMKSKTEKKKKKDKHKHKEKDKSKDKEERKKHKKDKDRRKDKERQLETEQNPVKIKISKDKLNLPAMDNLNPQPSTGFKIKIPKDRIKGELTNFQTEDISKNPHPPIQSSLKIKISKDKIENFNNQQQECSYQGSSGSHHGHGSSSNSNSSKKKDRDRDRDIKKKSDYIKQNGNGNKDMVSGANLPIPSKSQQQQPSNQKMQHFNGGNLSMRQLFGESCDDEDEYFNNDYFNNENFESDLVESKDN